MCNARPLFNVISVFSNGNYTFHNKLMSKHIRLLYVAGIRTHNFLNMGILPEPLDQGSPPHVHVVGKRY